MNEPSRVPVVAPEPPFPGDKPSGKTSKARTLAFGRNLRVLVVEQNSIFALAAEDILLRGGASAVRIAATQAEALQHLVVAQYDIALVDLKLADDGGPLVAARLLSLGIPFAFTAEFGARASLPPAFADRMVIHKPYDEANLMSCLSRLLGRRP